MSSAEALRDILRFLNTHDFKRETAVDRRANERPGDDADEWPLYIAENAIVAGYAGLRLGSYLEPIVAPNAGPVGYKALVAASFNSSADYRFLDIAKLTPTAGDRQEVIYLDRLTRTLHALNYLAKDLSGDLHLSVNPRHLLEVHENHGEVFEQILAKCGLQTDQIVLEIAEYAVPDKQHLKLAIAGWKKRRYRIAFDGIGTDQAQLTRVLNLKPDIIKFDSDLIARSAVTLTSRKRFEIILDNIYADGIEVIATNVESATLHDELNAFSLSALQGSWLTNYDAAKPVQKTA